MCSESEFGEDAGGPACTDDRGGEPVAARVTAVMDGAGRSGAVAIINK
ncbi:hypothetical protein ACFWP7_05285 [Streptomyces sp. NPDC058470]